MSEMNPKERLKGKLQIVEDHIQTMNIDLVNLETRIQDAQSKAFAHKTSIQSIESLHAHLDNEDISEDWKRSNHQWIDRSRQIVESLLHSLDLEVKMAHGAKMYIQARLKKYQEEKSLITQDLSSLPEEVAPVKTVAVASKPRRVKKM